MRSTMRLTLYGDPRTKKNSARILKAHANRRIVAPSEAFMQYQEKVPVADQTALQPHHSPRKRAVRVLHGNPAQG